MPRVKCYNCGAENDPVETPAYCNQCGGPLPAPTSFGQDYQSDADDAYTARQPRPSRHLPLDSEDDSFSRDIRQSKVTAAETSAKKWAAGVLFAVAGLTLVCGIPAVIGSLMAENAAVDESQLIFTAIFMAGIGIVFAGLGVWALFQPLPASIIGLVLYVLITIWDLVTILAAGVAGPVLIGLMLRLVIVALFVRAIQASAQASRLRKADY